ncbi:MAG TPA: hypothetical protein VGG75_06020 [Trebonia sp.]|jgi:hypothetical protein
MSSAILYVAIVAIWACVLIPRWLRHGSPTAENHNHHQAERPVASVPEEAPLSLDEDEEEEETPAPEPVAPAPLTRAQAREKMMKARRRLLILLIALEAASGALTMMRLTALWVLIPPTIMLGGYLLLLREAALMDTERVRREAEAQTALSRARAAARDRDRPRRAQASAPPAPAPAAPPVPEPGPEDYDDLGDGRDYAPGLAGKYTASNSEVIDLSEYKRAVGD